jgi:hypothetical protein
VHLELRPLNKDERPYHARPFPIPKCYKETTKKEIKGCATLEYLLKSMTPKYVTILKEEKLMLCCVLLFVSVVKPPCYSTVLQYRHLQVVQPLLYDDFVVHNAPIR